MKRIAVVSSSPLLAEGGHLVLARSLVRALRERGHVADLIVTPQNRFGRQAAAYLATWMTDVGVAADGKPTDQVVSLRYPSFAVRHAAHVCWLNHRMREYYDLWERFSEGLSRRARVKERLRRRLIHLADHYLLTRNVSLVYAQSKTIQARLQRWGHIPSEVLYPPAPQRPYRCDGYGDYLFAVSRLTPLKRIDLLIDALASPQAAGIVCVIAGDGDEAPRLAEAIRARGLDGRVRLVGAIGEPELLAHLARCRAVCFAPFNEDYGLVTVEAFASRKAIITCHDSGGPAELVRHGENGFVCEPTAAGLADAMRRVADDAALAERLGQAGYASTSSMTWESAVERLLVV